ncbi:MAG: hypothetical protein RLZZ511_3985, partial [Cyanobacteriota bacterium]
MRFDRQLATAALLTLASTLTLAVLPSMAQDAGDEGNLPSCNRRSNGNWMCVYDRQGGEVDGSPYKSFEGSIRGGIPNGYGVLVFDNDDRYEGNVRNGVPEGKGKFVFANNDRYEGSVKKGKPDGYGMFSFGDGGSYKGSFLAGQPHGNGTHRFAGGEVFTGVFYL